MPVLGCCRVCRFEKSAAAGMLFWALIAGLAFGNPPGGAWQAPLAQDHPIVGQIWDVAAREVIDPTTLVERLRRGRFILLGEKHDNPDHHRLQAWLLRALVAEGRRPAVGFEMFTVDQAPAIARQLSAHPTDAAALAEAVEWQRSGWPAWEMYQPIAEAALEAKLSILSSNLAPAMVRALGQSGTVVLDQDFVARYGLDQPLAPETQEGMLEEIRAAHCGYASEAHVKTMLLVQRARDAQMAVSLAAAGQQDGAVLIAGAGHVRRDYGVPTYLARTTPQGGVISVALMEVSREKLDPLAYTARYTGSVFPFDYVWFTPRVDDDDPCTAFAEQLRQLQHTK